MESQLDDDDAGDDEGGLPMIRTIIFDICDAINDICTHHHRFGARS